VAHTSLRAELPYYFPRALAGACAAMGGRLDRYLCRRHRGALAISPLLARMLSEESGCAVHSISIPWQLTAPATATERSAARHRLELSPERRVVLYAGNLDAYQGLEPLIESVARLAKVKPELTWLIATMSPTQAFAQRLAAAGLRERVLFQAPTNEDERRMVYAAAELALVPRAAPGGLPVKLLDALSRNIPVVTTRTALAGHALPSNAVTLVEDCGGWDVAIDRVLTGHAPEPHIGGEFMVRGHGAERFVSDLIAHAARMDLLRVPGK
jgi:glycosyltransferase involved in cell wall biosynthesis